MLYDFLIFFYEKAPYFPPSIARQHASLFPKECNCAACQPEHVEEQYQQGHLQPRYDHSDKRATFIG